MDTEKMTLLQIVEQLRLCRFTCEAGDLENNVAFVQLAQLAERVQSNRMLALILALDTEEEIVAMQLLQTAKPEELERLLVEATIVQRLVFDIMHFRLWAAEAKNRETQISQAVAAGNSQRVDAADAGSPDESGDAGDRQR